MDLYQNESISVEEYFQIRESSDALLESIDGRSSTPIMTIMSQKKSKNFIQWVFSSPTEQNRGLTPIIILDPSRIFEMEFYYPLMAG
ncbi:hypothetical protein ACW2QC_03545 [Virgibacillus sp. FSP13]